MWTFLEVLTSGKKCFQHGNQSYIPQSFAYEIVLSFVIHHCLLNGKDKKSEVFSYLKKVKVNFLPESFNFFKQRAFEHFFASVLRLWRWDAMSAMNPCVIDWRNTKRTQGFDSNYWNGNVLLYCACLLVCTCITFFQSEKIKKHGRKNVWNHLSFCAYWWIVSQRVKVIASTYAFTFLLKSFGMVSWLDSEPVPKPQGLFQGVFFSSPKAWGQVQSVVQWLVWIQCP